MAPVRHAAAGQTGSFATRGEGVSLVGFRNKNVKRRTWRPNHPQAFAGSVREGQGFAFRRKLKIQQNYKKLIWREKKAKTSRESQFTDRYPDHLKHLYLAEEERLRKQLRKADQSLLEQVDQPLSEEQVDQPLPEEQCSIDQALSEEHCSIEQPHPEEQCSIRINSITIPKKNKKKTSNQKAQEEYEQIQAKRAAKRQEFERRKQEREEAQRLYKKKKMEVFKILSKKTKKGQPNLNLQMEYLLKKIQEKN
ncbi:thyroid transcription factor 1-associated protein 26 [Physeter macrocephalus]|uniref:Thyroid transcription factor 1-associated protein 26 n=1 Tax=Physeter macrocephalus TaxID=9755 RepID=A0A2Y9FNG3_PHYMC|nr:thyroid transcription factor 1-associated protein 26 [Physeter catodon]XP_007126507.1 thyroid transcription factor 1-associated protein 26 [Physeter catodon]|eukprot:XP_007126506.1 thyroid transcription factor 1-associated protein 26 isoform X1 [Physeter catodon]